MPLASAQTVKIGNETKKTSGVVVSLESGDIACYVTLKDDKGVERTEMADFEICEKRSLIGKRVELTFELQSVMSEECQGDPDCTKTRNAAVITGVRVASGPAGKPAAPKKPAPVQTSFCTPNETIVFACRTGGKLVSVCASRDASPKRGYVQYRFGKPGEPLELTLPEGEVSPPRAAAGESVPYSGGGAAWMRFQRGAYAYVVYTGIGNWGPRGEKVVKEGVVVERGGKRVAALPCSNAATSELGPDWFEQAGITSGGQEFELPD